ncbi:S41 family peptidase [Pedobacter sandarakinus]|uniref:S41 family peptidase n=1 Tax=Pedobacter sandarakinus TaxID=353156 RepID=UPI002246219B|nr:S41 family peptidase [Pedobacter sandarakinus]MCX2575400.1 S41 family peptidase [Pedobacter sandarakinus]
MKKTLSTLLILLTSICSYSQIQNSSFEFKGQTGLPTDWGTKLIEGYNVNIDDSVAHSGKTSIKIAATDLVKPNTFQSVYQIIALQPSGIRKVTVSGYAKIEAVAGDVAYWCQIWDKDNKIIGFQNTQSQHGKIQGTADWKKYSLELTLPRETRKLLFGFYLMGKGTVWLDDFDIVELPMPSVAPSDEVAKYVDEFKNIIKNNSIYKDSLNWADIDVDLKYLSMGLKTIDDSKSVTGYLMAALKNVGDNHSFIQSKVTAQKYASGNMNPEKLKFDLFDGAIGYISVPGFSSLDQKTKDVFANNIQQELRKMDLEHTINGWIVDLRENTGGNMYPMIAGLGPLTGSGTLGYFMARNGDEKKVNPWYYMATKKNKATMGVNITAPYTLKNSNPKIAVLVGPKTSSSGEMTAISFIGKSNVKLFGEPTGGYTSANAGFELSDGSFLYLAVSYTADRNKKEYRSKIIPDVLVKSSATDDAAINQAKIWINGK